MEYRSLKNWLFQSKNLLRNTISVFLCILLLNALQSKSQIVNYVNNGGFENLYSCDFPAKISKAKFWRGIDSLIHTPVLFSICPGLNNVPVNQFTYQWPRNGETYAATTLYCATCQPDMDRRAFRNRLKSNLQMGRTYCVTFYVNVFNNSTYGMDSFSAYFGDDHLDTISKGGSALPYLNPQIENPIGNIISDTLGWTKITGIFIAAGNEKHLVIGNFKLNANVNDTLINPGGLPIIGTDIAIDDVSCIDIDLPAFAGIDTTCVPGSSVYIGRERDIGIDDACVWYEWPDVINPIDTAAGLWVSPTETSTYIVKQEICGNIKWDTVVVYQNIVGLEKLKIINEEFRIYPVPANDFIELRISNTNFLNGFKNLSIFNKFGQLIRKEEFNFIENSKISTEELPNGIYFIQLKSNTNETVSKRFVIVK